MLTDSDIKDFMLAAYLEARKSPDESNQNGAVIIDPAAPDVSHVGFNDFLFPGAEKFPRPQKYWFVTHAEEAACRSSGEGENLVMFCPWAACSGCARDIFFTGVKRLYVHKQRMLTTPDRWRDEVEASLAMLAKKGVTITEVDLKFDLGFTIKVNGEDWTP